jgi:galactoside O-acetyltransferase
MSCDDGPDRGLAAIGQDVRIHVSALIFGAEHVEIGDHVRIDAHVVITAGPGVVRLGDYVHLGVGSQIFGTAGVELAEFSGLSPRVSVFSTSDDYSGGALTNPTVPEELRDVSSAPVRLGRHAIVGAGSVVLPGADVGEGAAVGALSLVTRAVAPYTIVAGTPARRVAERRRDRMDELARHLR